MAKCDEGYLCEVCGADVADIRQSDLYLRFVIGELDPERLHRTPERHIHCNPVLAQFIADERFQMSGSVPDGFAASELDPDYVRQRRLLVTQGWKRLLELYELESEIPIYEYPLAEVRHKWQ